MTPKFKTTLNKIYPKLEKISHDDLIATNTTSNDALVIVADTGWYGFGDWEAIKQALQESPDDVITHGKVIHRNSKNCIIYNYTPKLLACIDQKDQIIVATKDVTMTCPFSSIPEIKKLLKDFEGTEYEKYT